MGEIDRSSKPSILSDLPLTSAELSRRQEVNRRSLHDILYVMRYGEPPLYVPREWTDNDNGEGAELNGPDNVSPFPEAATADDSPEERETGEFIASHEAGRLALAAA